MSATAASQRASSPPGLGLAARFALRELRGGLRGFYVFIACIALGVAAIAGVGSLAGSLADGLAREGRVILGGDISFTLIHREADESEQRFLDGLGDLAVNATMRAMARTADGRATLVEAKAVDAAYPLFRSVVLQPEAPLADTLAERNGVFGGAVDATLLERLRLRTGDIVTVGSARIEIRATILSEPDKLSVGIGFGPRLMLSQAALRASGLIQPGSLVRWHYRVRLDRSAASEADVRSAVASARARFPEAGWEIRSRTNASPQLERNVTRFTQFLTIVGLTALLVGGVGVGNAVKSHLDRKRDVIATMKALGASGSRVFAIYLIQTVVLAGLGGAIGVAAGAALPYGIAGLFAAIVPLPIEPNLQPVELALAFVYGVVTALAFALWPLGRAHDVPVGALFRDAVAPQPARPRRIYVLATAVAVLTLGALAIVLAYDRRVAVIYVAAAAGVFVLLRLVAAALIGIARRLPRPRNTMLRMAVANIHRPGALTPSIVLSLGLGIALLVTVIQIDGNLRDQFAAALPERAPAFFFLDIPVEQAEEFNAFIRERTAPAVLEGVPMLRGRIVSANGVRAEDIKPRPEVAWVLQGDRGITYADEPPGGSRIADGRWWPKDYDGAPLVSFEAQIARGLGLRVGDPVTVNVLGRNITARVANLREVDWQSLGINFVIVFSPNAFRGAPHTRMATLTWPSGASPAQEGTVIRDVADRFPTVTTVRVKDALDAVAGLVGNLVLGIRIASAVTLVTAALVLGGALAAGHRHRVYDAVILKTLGAIRRRLLGAYLIEYLLLGAATAVFGVLAGTVSAWVIVTELMNLGFIWQPMPAIAAALGAMAITVLLGLAGTFAALGQKPAPVLRNL